METASSLIIIAVSALIHASFQLSISMLTLLSSHTIGRKRSQARLLLLSNAFTLGVGIMTLLLFAAVAMLLSPLVAPTVSPLMWTVCCGLLAGVGFAVWIFYYRQETGTTLWIPRSLARFMTTRTKATKQSGEAFSLGVVSVLGEFLFIFAPIMVSALVLLQLSPYWQLAGIGLYTVISLGSLLLVNALIGSGLSISRIQKWRESNKRFLQFAAGTGLFVLSFYLYVDQVVSTAALAAAGSV